MKPKLLPKFLSFSGNPSSLLVCETDGFTLRSTVIRRQGEHLVAAFSAQSRAQDYKQAVAEVVEQLRGHGWIGNSKAILLMPGVVSALIELPVSPKSPRPPLQMQELVRWELEPLLMEHTTLWSVGHVLVGLGYLTEEEAKEVLARQQGKLQGTSHDARLELYSLKRYGEVAMEQGYIDRRQLDEALARQGWLRMEGGEIACGWAALPGVAEKAEQGLFPWLVSGVNQGLMRQWEEAFSACGVALEALFPAAGCAAMLAPEQGSAIVLEIGGGQVAGIRLGANGTEAILTHESSLNGVMEACLEIYHGLTPPEPDTLWLASGNEGTAELVKNLKSFLGRDIQLLETRLSGVSASVTAGMAGAARQMLGMGMGVRCCPVPTRGPRIPLRSHPVFRLGAGCGLIVLGIALAETVLQVRQGLAESEAEKVNARAAELDAAVAHVQARIDAVKKLKDEIRAKQDEAALIGGRVGFLGDELPRRAALLRTLFDELGEAVTEEVVIDRLAEEPKQGIVVNAWALTESAAQQFAEALRLGMESWNMTLTEVSVTERVGRLGMPGYAVTFRIADKLSMTAPQPPQPTPVQSVKKRRNR